MDHLDSMLGDFWCNAIEKLLIHFLQNVKVMAHPLAGASVERGVDVELR